MTARKTTSGMPTSGSERVGETMGERMGENSSQRGSRQAISDRDIGMGSSTQSTGASMGGSTGASSSTSRGASIGQDEEANVIGGHDNRSGPGPYIMAADSLNGDSVTNSAGENLGDIKSIMIDVPRGQVAYAVLAFGGVLGLGEKLFAIPWNALTLDADNKCFVLDVDKQQLKQAPGFDKSHWPSMADETWASSVHSFYGRRPYWESRTQQDR